MGSRRSKVGRVVCALTLVMAVLAAACATAPDVAEPEQAPDLDQSSRLGSTSTIHADPGGAPSDLVPAPPPPPPYPPVCAAPLADGATVPVDDWTPAPRVEAGLTRVASATAGQFVVHTVGGERTFLNGVNLGASLPGGGPEDWMVGRRTYTAWLRQIGAMGFRSVRTYTLHPAAFYRALADYNTTHPNAPIYLMQGVWLPETEAVDLPLVADEELTAAFDQAIAETVAGLAGRRPDAGDPRLGSYTTDVTPWLAGMVIGVEWDPAQVVAAGALPRSAMPGGRFVVAAGDATRFEQWLAGRMDRVAVELSKSDVAAPLSFINWAATDPLPHPTETQPELDRVGIDPTRLAATEAWPAGLFATYHVYPYSPGFIQTEPGIADYELDGTRNPYAGYLAQLRDYHGEMPVVVGETGVPGGWLSAGDGPGGHDYGGLLEAHQMAANAELVEAAYRLGLGGSLLFEWADEWFKPTWNLTDLERGTGAAWHNLLSPEQHFGVLAVEPVPAAVMDGMGDDWDPARVVAAGEGVELSVAHDAAALYVMVRGSLPDQFEVRVDTDPLLRHPDDVDPTGEVSIRVFDDRAEVYERSAYRVRSVPAREGDLTTIEAGETGPWEPFSLLTDYATADRPATVAVLDTLRRSEADGMGAVPAAEAGWARSRNVVELRIPWTVLGVADPSTGTVLRFGDSVTVTTRPSVGVTVMAAEVLASGEYRWDTWELPHFRQRLKQGSGTLAAALCRTSYFYR